MKSKQSKFIKGDLITIKSHPMQELITGQQYFEDFINVDNYLGVVVSTNEEYAVVSWVKHPTSQYRITDVRTKFIKRVHR
tara:strand:+ start:2358 stop:2597 length:240 start_codon:yes stop_codon:yes gene_type:complete